MWFVANNIPVSERLRLQNPISNQRPVNRDILRSVKTSKVIRGTVVGPLIPALWGLRQVELQSNWSYAAAAARFVLKKNKHWSWRHR